MPWGASTWVAVIPELGYGVPWTAAPQANMLFPTLVGGNSFTMRKVPIRQVIRSADGGNRRKFVVGSRRVYTGSMTTLLHPDQCANTATRPGWVPSFLSSGYGMATGQVALSGTGTGASATAVSLLGSGFGYPASISSTTTASGQTGVGNFFGVIPVSFIGPPSNTAASAIAYGAAQSNSSGNVTAVSIIAGGAYNSPPGVQIGGMPSFTLLYWDSMQLWQFNGACVQSVTVTASAAQDYVNMTINWIAQQRISTPTMSNIGWPAATNYSVLNPYMFVETTGLCTIGTNSSGTGAIVPLTNYRQMSFTLENVLQGTWDEEPYVSSILYCGRNMNFSIGPQYFNQLWPTTNTTGTAASPQTFRTDYENQLPLTFSLQFSRSSPSHSLTINAESNSYVSNIQDDLPLDNASYQNISAEAFIDSTTTLGSDFTIAAT